MTTIYSSNGIDVDQRFRVAPSKHWIQDTVDYGHYVQADVSTGYYPLVETVAPIPNDHTRTTERGAGDFFEYVYTFDQTKQDARLAAEADEVLRQEARDAIVQLNAYLALGSPTNAQVKSAVDYLARVSKRLIIDNYGS